MSAIIFSEYIDNYFVVICQLKSYNCLMMYMSFFLMIKKDWASMAGYPHAFISDSHVPFSGYYLCLSSFECCSFSIWCLTAARKLIDSIYSGFCDESKRERDYFLVLIYFVTCLEKWIGFLCVRRLCFLKDKCYPIAYNQSKCLLFIIFPYYNQ